MSIKKTILTAAACGVLISASVCAEPATSEKQAGFVLKTRQAIFTLMGGNMGPMGGMLKGQVPYDAALVEKNATRILQLSHMIPDAFVIDTREYDLDTEALDVIWEKKADFDSKTQDLQKAAEALVAVAGSGDEGAVKNAIGGVGKTCGGCHDDFKAD